MNGVVPVKLVAEPGRTVTVFSGGLPLDLVKLGPTAIRLDR